METVKKYLEVLAASWPLPVVTTLMLRASQPRAETARRTKEAQDGHRPPRPRLPPGAPRALISLWLVLLVSHLSVSRSSEITSLSPPNGPTMGGGADIFLLGEGLSIVDLGPKARVSGTACSSTRWVSQSAVICRMDALDGGIGLNLPVALTVVVYQGVAPASLLLQATPRFSFDSFAVSAASPHNSPTTSSPSPVLLFAAGLSPVDYSVAARIGVSACLSSRWVADTCVSCKAGPSYLENLSLGITMARSVVSSSEAFSYDRPAILGLSPTNAGLVQLTTTNETASPYYHMSLEAFPSNAGETESEKFLYSGLNIVDILGH
jgi:hypothetical protein